MHGKAQRVARPAQTRLQNSRVTGPKFTKFLTDVEWSSAVLTHAYTSWFSHSLWNASAQNDGGVCHFRRFAPKSVTIPTSLERSRKDGQTDHVNPYVYISWKFVEDRSTPVHCILRQLVSSGTVKNNESNIGACCTKLSAARGRPGWLNKRENCKCFIYNVLGWRQ